VLIPTVAFPGSYSGPIGLLSRGRAARSSVIVILTEGKDPSSCVARDAHPAQPDHGLLIEYPQPGPGPLMLAGFAGGCFASLSMTDEGVLSGMLITTTSRGQRPRDDEAPGRTDTGATSAPPRTDVTIQPSELELPALKVSPMLPIRTMHHQ